jgi:proline dehydrogenase
VKRRLRRAAGVLLRLAIRLAARLFVRGSKLGDAIDAGARLAARGRATTLGYFNSDGDAPRAVADACVAALDAIARAGAGADASGDGAARATRPYLSIKVPALGFDDALVGEIVDRAATAGVGVHFDSHGADEADPTFAAIAAATHRRPDHAASGDAGRDGQWRLGCTLPGRWPRSLDDAGRVAALGLRVRVVKGQWADPGAPAVDPRQGFLAVIDRLAGNARQVAVASHDAPLAREALRRLQHAGTPAELELLLGLPMQGALHVARELKVPVRIYIPFGISWLPYAMLHVQKNPQVAWWALRDATLGRFITPPAL